MGEYQSSEELQRSVFAPKTEEAPRDVSELERLAKKLDFYIKQHSNTVAVRKLAKTSGRTNDYQLDLSADLVEILEKIKSEMR